jgi:FkbM family methyltransferase
VNLKKLSNVTFDFKMAFKRLKTIVEKSFHLKIFRKSLPFGTDLQTDIKRYFKEYDFKIVFDVGANIGQTVTKFREEFTDATIYSFEPVSYVFELLQKNVSHLSGVETFKLAFGSENKILPIYLDEDSKKNSFMADGQEQKEFIQVETLDGFTDRYNIERINFLKIDTEGFDLNVLKGAQDLLQKHAVDFIQVETGFHQNSIHVNIDDFLNYLKQFDYALFGIYEQQPYWSGEPWLLYANAIFIRKSILETW